jgi:hypothetical protein
MKISHWIIVASFIAPLFACSSSDSDDPAATGGTGGGTAGTGAGGSVVTGGTGGGTAGTGGSTAGTGGSTAGTGGGTAGTGGSTSQCTLEIADDPTCTGCFQDKCESQCVGVMSEATVTDYINCYSGCSDQTCVDGCDAQYPEAAAAYGAFDDCIANECATECPVSSGSCIIQWTDATCDDCFQAACATECETYSTLPDGADHFNCILACDDDACMQTCDQTYPDAADPLNAVMDCAGAQCGDECNINNTTSECGMVSSTQTCNDCFDAQCFDSCKAVADHPDVSAYLTCYNGCSDQACIDGCDTTYAEMSALFTTFDTCITDNCSTECATP